MEKWSIERLFDDERNGNPFSRGPEEMLLWECHGDDSATCVWRGYDEAILRSVVLNFQKNASPNTHYCVEFPNRKGELDSPRVEKRKFEGGAKCLPKPKNQFLVTLIENKWGATLNESVYMATKGRILEFYMRTDKNKTPVFTFTDWEEAKALAFMKRRR